jgi:DNA-binding protein HU-beta
MTKADIVKEIAQKTGIDKNTVLQTVEVFMDVVKENMIAGENIYLRGFGSFILKRKAEKLARNISKNTTIKIPAHFAPAFKPSKSFSSVVASKVK